MTDLFQPRDYQIPAINAFEDDNYLNLLLVWARRSGKDLLAWNLMIRRAIAKVGVYYYVLPTAKLAKAIIWDNITIEGKRMLDYIPREIIKASNATEMKVTLWNNSIIKLVGSTDYDKTLVGTNPMGMVWSEYQSQDENAYLMCRPILMANKGWSIFIGTPRGRRNHLYRMFEIARANPKHWFSSYLTVDDTHHISKEDMQREVDEGFMTEDLIQQEYYCSWERGQAGAYYADYIDRMYLEDRITSVLPNSMYPVHTAWDIGMHDDTSIIFFQVLGQNVHIIDYYSNRGHGIEHYIRVVKDKDYDYERHIAPHDMDVTSFSTGYTRTETAAQLGIEFDVLPRSNLQDGINMVRNVLPRTFIDEDKCKPLIKALENYRREWNEKHQVYKPYPLHDKYSHAADAMRYLALGMPRSHDALSRKEIDESYRRAALAYEPIPHQTPDSYYNPYAV